VRTLSDLKEDKLIRKTFVVALVDLEKLNQKFDSQFELSDYLRTKIEESYLAHEFVVSYTMPKSIYDEARTQRSVFFEQQQLQKYNDYVRDAFGLDSQKKIDNKVSQIFTSLVHKLALAL